MATKRAPIKYTSREFDTIKTELLKYAKINYPEKYQDFSEASFGSMVFDSVAYVGDMLSFYLDYQVNELFLDTATEYDNVIKLGAQLGYRYEGRPSSTGILDVFCLVPANSLGLGPDENYMPIVESGASVSSLGGASFMTVSDIRFDDSSSEVIVAKVNDTTGIPTHYAVKTSVEVISGEILSIKKSMGAYEKFKKIKISNSDVAEIISVVDSAGREYFEVPYLSQNVIYKDVSNRGTDSKDVPSILRPFQAPRRFVVERLKDITYLQFGHGSESEMLNSSVAEPSKLTLNMHGRSYITDESFDPSKLMSTDKFGIAPHDTTLTIRYRVNSSPNLNVSANGLKNIRSVSTKFKDSTALSKSKMDTVRGSLEVSNPEAINGGIRIPDTQEIKRRSIDSFSNQNRAVTIQDIESMSYIMPTKYGGIKRCKARKAQGTRRRNIELYVLSEDSTGKLSTASTTLKNNLKIWLSEKKMINDTIDILNGKVVNFGIEFSIIADHNENKYDVLNSAIQAVQSELSEPLYIGQPLYVSDIYGILNKVRGVVDSKDVKIVNKTGIGYSSISIDMDNILSADGLTVETPENVALEVKYPDSDIKGSLS